MRRRGPHLPALLAGLLLAGGPPAAAAPAPLPPAALGGAPAASATAAHLRRIRPAAAALWGLTAALSASVLGCGLGALAASDRFAAQAYVGAAPPPALAAEGARVFQVALATDILGIFAISAAVGAVVLTVTGYGPPARAAEGR